MHVPYSQVSDSISEIVWEAFEEADHIYPEVDLTSPKAVVDEVKKSKLLPGHQKLSDVLPEELYSRLKS